MKKFLLICLIAMGYSFAAEMEISRWRTQWLERAGKMQIFHKTEFWVDYGTDLKKWKTDKTSKNIDYTLWVGPTGTQRTLNYRGTVEWYLGPGGKSDRRSRINWVVTKETTTPNTPLWSRRLEGGQQRTGYQVRVYHKRLPGNGSFLGKMDKPVVMTQGFDPNYKVHTMSADDMEDIFGKKHIQNLIDQGYSVVLVMFENPTDSIDYNAKVTLDALKWVQTQAAGKDLVLLGPSMGGLVMRRALLRAAAEGAPIHPRLFIAYDSPNWGAVIPSTVQAAAHYYRDGDADQAQLYRNLTSPAANEMLLYQIKGTTTEIDGYFQKNDGVYTKTRASQYLRWLNHPNNWASIRTLKSQDGTPIKMLAVADGTPNTEQGLPVNTKFCDYDYWTLDWEMSTPNPGVKKQITRFDPANKWEKKYQFREPVFTENLPGGLRPSYTSIKMALRDKGYYGGSWDLATSPFLTNGKIHRDEYGDLDVVPDENQVTDLQKAKIYKGHAFIPTLSAVGYRIADLKGLNIRTNWNLPNTTSLSSSQSWFDQAYMASYNWMHVSPYNLQKASPVHSTIYNLITMGQP